MRRRRESWIEVFRSLGRSILEVLRAEWAVLAEEWARSGKHLGWGAALLGAVGFLAFWTVPLVLFAIVLLVQKIFGLSLLVTAWLTVLVGVLVMAGIAAFAWFVHLRRLESPVAAASRRVSDHVAWWESRLLPPEDRVVEGAADETVTERRLSGGDDDE